ncbi:MAG: hypothetical protein ABEH56_01130 [Salinirussus sp.]
MTDRRDDTGRAIAACRDELPDSFGGGRLGFGFDGVVDRVRTMIESRQGPGEYDRLDRLAGLEERVQDSVATGSSLTVEWEQTDTRTGGHACHLARAFDELGAETTMIGTYGRPTRDRFAREFDRSTIVSVGEPGVCDAVEFDDGKLLLTEPGEAAALDWTTLTDRIDPATLATHLDGLDVFGVGYWSVTASLPALLAALVERTWPRQQSPPDRVFLDPGDVRGLTPERIREGAARLRATAESVPVTVSANRPETETIAAAAEDRKEASGDQRRDARRAREVLGVDEFVAHGSERSVAVGGETVAVRVARTDSPALTTSAGDHFNAGYLLGELADLSLAAKTVLGNAAAGVFVRTGRPPGYAEIVDYVGTYRERLANSS